MSCNDFQRSQISRRRLVSVIAKTGCIANQADFGRQVANPRPTR
jgi:hypothetical protein